MRKLLMISACAIVITSSNVEALHFEDPTIVDTGIRQFAKLLPTHNEALDKALDVHNLMTELPGLQAVARQRTEMESSKKMLEDYQKNLLKCNEKRLGRFKNPKDVLKKLRETYQKRVSDLKLLDANDEKLLVSPVIAEKHKLYGKRKEIEVELLTDALKNGKKWGGQYASKPRTDVSDEISRDIVGTGLEELALTENGLHDARIAITDVEKALKETQEGFVEKLAAVGVSVDDFDLMKTSDIEKIRKELIELKTQHIADAKEYIEKLNAQDIKYPNVAKRRAAQSENKKDVLKSAQKRFPEAFENIEVTVDQRTPQQKQMALIVAMEKDSEGKVFLTEVNALEVDQKIAEMKASENLMQRFEGLMSDMRQNELVKNPTAAEFDFSRCGD